MRRHLALTAAVVLLSCGCPATVEHDAPGANPLLSAYETPYELPPFDRIEAAHFVPAFNEGMDRQLAEIELIVANPEAPSFANTVAALDRSGELLSELSAIFYGLSSANTNDEIQAIEKEMSPRLAAHRDAIRLNPRLFQRIRAVYEARAELALDQEQLFLLEKLYGDYVRNGALLDAPGQARLQEINQELSKLRVAFNSNLLAETNDFQLVVDDEADLAGLPAAAVASAAAAATAAGHEGRWLFTTHKPSLLPFLSYGENRELRRRLFTAYTMRGNNDNEHDNKEIMARIIELRVERARLLGYATHADYVLERRMAETPERVYELLDRLWDASLPVAREERRQMQAIIDAEGGGFALAPWDWWYYAEKLRKASYDLDDSELRPYFALEAVRDGVFHVASQLYGLSFEPVQGLPKPHPDAQVFRVTEADGAHCAIIYMDFHPRASKRQGAWCGGYRSQNRSRGVDVDPIVNLVCNFTTPTKDAPALLSLDEVQTLFHEFGHALDVMLSDVTYRTTYRSSDFSELPSQIMEHWALEPEVMRVYARHYLSGDAMPEELIAKIHNSRQFNQGFEMVEYLAASLLDMEYHTLQEASDLDVVAFEQEYFDRIGLLPEIVSRYRSTYFAHIVGGYAAGYYGYIWSGVLDSDAFEAFRETSLFDRETAQRFRREILAPNGTRSFMDMYLAFRGREPEIEPLLRNKGLL